MRNFAALGRTPEQALAAAATAPGRFWKESIYGRIAPGLPADLALLTDLLKHGYAFVD